MLTFCHIDKGDLVDIPAESNWWCNGNPFRDWLSSDQPYVVLEVWTVQTHGESHWFTEVELMDDYGGRIRLRKDDVRLIPRNQRRSR